MSKKRKVLALLSALIFVCCFLIWKTSYTLSDNTRERAASQTATSDVYYQTGGQGSTVASVYDGSGASIKLLEFNTITADQTNTISPKFKIINTGNGEIQLNKVKIKYFYSEEGSQNQSYWCDWSNKGSSNVTGTFYKTTNEDNADTCFQLGFSDSAGVLKPGEEAEMYIRIANADWSNYTQSNDYSFNSSASNYSEFNKVNLYYNDSHISGDEPQAASNPTNPSDPTNPDNPTPSGSNVQLRISMYNGNTANMINSLTPRFKIENIGKNPADLSKLKIRYYYTVDGLVDQKYWCDWCSLGQNKITGSFHGMENPNTNADSYFELGFDPSAGQLQSGEEAQVHMRIAKDNWSNYIQYNDYSFNNIATNYAVYDKITADYNGKNIFGTSPVPDLPPVTHTPKVKIYMYNGNTAGTINTLFPRFKIENAGVDSLDLSKLKIRYYFTSDGSNDEKFWCDYSDRGASNITGSFTKLPYPQPTADTYFELGFTSADGELHAGATIEAHIRIAKDDWSNYNEANDYSFNNEAKDYVYWEKALAFYDGNHIFPDSLSFKAPKNVKLTSAQDSIQLTFDPVPGATGYDIEAAGSIIDNGNNTTFVQNGLMPDTQENYRIRARNDLGYCDWSPYYVMITKPAAPSNIKTTATKSAINLSWDEAPGASCYDLEFDGKEYTVEGNTYAFNGLESDSVHSIRIRSGNSDGYGAWGDYFSVSTLLDDIANVDADESINSVQFTWTGVKGAEKYDLEIDGTPAGSVEGTSYTANNLSAGTKHIFRVRAENSKCVGNWYEQDVCTKLGTPQNIKTDAKSDSIKVTWDAVEGASGYEIKVNGSLINQTGDTSILIDKLNSFTKYTINVRAKNSNVTGEWSSDSNATTLLAVPINITASATDKSIRISWNPVNGADGYEVMLDGNEIDTGSNSYYEMTNLQSNTPHIFRVLAKNSVMKSAWSEASAVSTKLSTPQNIKAEASSTSMKITWDAVSSATNYNVEFDDKDYTVEAPDTYLVVDSLLPSTEHKFRVKAINGSNESDWTDTNSEWSAEQINYTAPEPPSNVNAIADFDSIELTWAASLNATGYEVDFDGTISQVSGTSFKCPNLAPNTRHTYRVRAVNQWGSSDWTQEQSVYTKNEIAFNISEDNLFNFIVTIPYKSGQTSRFVSMKYNPDEVEAVDLCASTPEQNLGEGNINGTNFTITKFIPDQGIIEFYANNVTTGVVNSIKFRPKKDVVTKLRYSIK